VEISDRLVEIKEMSTDFASIALLIFPYVQQLRRIIKPAKYFNVTITSIITKRYTTSHLPRVITTSHYHRHYDGHYQWTRYITKLPRTDRNKHIYINPAVIFLALNLVVFRCIPVSHSKPVPNISEPAPSLSIHSSIFQAPLSSPAAP
jgi:hypothetical protein